MDSNSIIYIVSGSLLGILLGIIAGFLIASRKTNEAENRATRFETMTNTLQDQVAAKDTEISRLNELDTRKQNQLLVAESSKTKAETELADAKVSIQQLGKEVDLHKGDNLSLRDSNSTLGVQNAELKANYDAALNSIAEQKKFLAEANVILQDAFASLSSSALRTNNSTFLELAEEKLGAKISESKLDLENRKQAIDTLIKPLGNSLADFNSKIQEIELKREGAYSGLRELITAMSSTTQKLADGTTSLVSALKTSHVRGKYGEISLRRVIEVAGLNPYCDFTEQQSVATEDGVLRPDCTVNLPGSRQLILDSKVPLNAYLDSFTAEAEADKIALLKKHAIDVRDHLKKLSKKSYWEQFADAPDFVIMYLHAESSFGAALMTDADLIEDGFKMNIVLATPSTLIGMLRTVGFMWQQERMARDVYEMRDAGVELYNRTNVLLRHFINLGKGLGKAVGSYNEAVGSLENRFIPAATKMKEIGGSLMPKEMPAMQSIDTTVRQIDKRLSEDSYDETTLDFANQD